MPEISEENILAGRRAVDSYRSAHAQLYGETEPRRIPKEHTSLLNKMIDELKGQGFGAIEEFFEASERLNINELGFKDKDEFKARSTDSDREKLESMWR